MFPLIPNFMGLLVVGFLLLITHLFAFASSFQSDDQSQTSSKTGPWRKVAF